MKIQCNVCEAAEANVLCCADEAALCWTCDEKVHAANKLASKHQRVSLSGSSSQMPKCDICQETVGYFFCLEDRALLCRKCDVAIHTVNSYVSGHQRFLLTGVKVGLEATEPVETSPNDNPVGNGKTVEKVSHPLQKSVNSISMNGGSNEVSSHQDGRIGGVPATKISFSGGTTTGNIPEWPLDDFLGLPDFNQHYGFPDHGSSKLSRSSGPGLAQPVSLAGGPKAQPHIHRMRGERTQRSPPPLHFPADNGKFGDSDSSPFSRASYQDFEVNDECLGKVPEMQWRVPEIPSPPTASGLFWPKGVQNRHLEDALFVPDIWGSSPPNNGRYPSEATATKRRRQC
ncbi:hypothetical protein Syun_009039 [Stephania yunnanensis]|uniref:B box-type domain-containing protein n=1 Tax=Stephania yunnanensis TaxID=152371 RepID=A0AAP0PQI6_9MAGN